MAIRHAPSCQRAEVVKGSTLVWQTADGKPVATLSLGAELIPAGSTCSEKRPSDDGERGTGQVELARESVKWAVPDVTEPENPKSRDARFALSTHTFAGSASLAVANGTHPIATMKHDGFLTGAAFTPDNRWLVTTSRDRTARVWALQSVDLIAGTCARVTRNLSTADWQRVRGDDRYVPICPDLPVPDK